MAQSEAGLTRARRKGPGWRTILLTLILIYVAVLFLVPFFWMIATSLKTLAQMYNPSVGFFPKSWTWSNYRELFTNNIVYEGVQVDFPIMQQLANTLEIAIPSMVGTVVSSAMVAYALSKLTWRGREATFWLVLATMMLPGWVTIIPLYVIFVQIHWINTFLPLIVPSFFGSPFFIFMLRQFFSRQPTSLLDAARIDGANELRIFLQIVVPLSKAALAVVALFAFMWSWTDFFSPLIFLSDPSKYTLMLGLAAFEGKHGTLWPQLMAANILIISPILLLFFLAQRQFIEGIHLTGING